jgi:hypothetical protein
MSRDHNKYKVINLNCFDYYRAKTFDFVRKFFEHKINSINDRKYHILQLSETFDIALRLHLDNLIIDTEEQ